MSSPAAEPRRILLLDFWSEKNRGDAAMQLALVRLVRRRLPEARVTVMAATGADQWPALAGELDHTGPLVDDVVGGLRIWLTGPFRAGPLHVPPIRKAVSGVNALLSIWLLAMLPILRRAPILARALPVELRRSIRAVQEADLVLWNCRNVKGEGPHGEAYAVWARLYDAAAAIELRRPVACVAASIWPLHSRVGRAIARTVLLRCLSISVRDPDSLGTARELLAGNVGRVPMALVPDLSLAVLDQSDRRGSPRPRRELRRLGLTLVDNRSAGPADRRAYETALRSLLATHLGRRGTEVVVVPQVTTRWQPTGAVLARVLDGLDASRVRVVPGKPTLDELMVLYRDLDLLVATRMHSAIFALCLGTPAVAIAYTSGGKWGILDAIGAGEVVVPYRGIDAAALAESVERTWRRRDELTAEVGHRLPSLAAQVDRHLELPLAALTARRRATDGSVA